MSTTTELSPDVVKALCSLPAALDGISGMQSQLDQIISGQETLWTTVSPLWKLVNDIEIKQKQMDDRIAALEAGGSPRRGDAASSDTPMDIHVNNGVPQSWSDVPAEDASAAPAGGTTPPYEYQSGKRPPSPLTTRCVRPRRTDWNFTVVGPRSCATGTVEAAASCTNQGGGRPPSPEQCSKRDAQTTSNKNQGDGEPASRQATFWAFLADPTWQAQAAKLLERDDEAIKCVGCNIWLNGPRQYDDHLKGRYHRKKSQQAGRG